MARVLVLTTDLPFFPGKNGHDFFNIRFLAQRHAVGVVAPIHDHYPPDGVANLEKHLHGSYFWPRPPRPVPDPPQKPMPSQLAGWVRLLPTSWRKLWLARLLGLRNRPSDALNQLATLSNCAPHLLQALAEQRWQVMALIQSNTEAWFEYLPAQPARFVYFHDVRSDYLRRQSQFPGRERSSAPNVPAVVAQERRVCQRADLAGFVSELDLQRALHLLDPACELGVAPIPVDTDYYTPAPAGWRKDRRPIVLFTGHLSHPPNVDAVLHFIDHTWPLVRAGTPEAIFQVVGLLPDPRVQSACDKTPGVELHRNVPDIRPYFWNASVYVVPMRFGGGVRQKIFEAWSMELPVVCTRMAAEGIPASHGVTCWLEDNPAAFAHRVGQLLQSVQPTPLAQAKQVVLTRNSIAAAAPQFETLNLRAVHIKKRKPFKLLFDLRWMRIGRAGGSEQMSHELLAAIAGVDHRNEYRILCPRSTFHEWDFPPAFQCRGIFSDVNEQKWESCRSGLANLLARSVSRPALLTPAMRALRWYNRLDFDLVQSMCSYIHPDLRAFPNILTVHDLQHVHFPEFFTPQARAERDSLYRESVKTAEHILCISEYTRMDVHHTYGVPLDKMTTVWNIPSRAAWTRLAEPQRDTLLAGMGVRGRFLFYPAHGWPHKNHRRLIEAFLKIRSEIPADFQLVLTGKPLDPEHSARELMDRPDAQKRVVHIGYRSPLEIRALYSGAHALVFPSLFEGFGMPVAEAIIADCPVACSRTTSLPEIGGNAAMGFDPTDVNDIARAIREITLNDRWRADLRAAGKDRKPLFSARLAAVKSVSVYRSVYERLYSA